MYGIARWLCVWVGVLSVSPGALAESVPLSGTYQVPDGKFLRLPATEGLLQLHTLAVGEDATLLVPASISGLKVERLTLSSKARISIAPRPERFEVLIEQANIGDGSVIAATGQAGNPGQLGGHGTDLLLEIAAGRVDNLTVDVSGGRGGDGRRGKTGSAGRDAACWGRGSSKGLDGGDGGDGRPGGNGGHLTLKLGKSEWLEVIDVLQYGGAGGRAGQAGDAGRGGEQARCWLYSLGDSAAAGQPGSEGQPAPAGRPGYLTVR